MTRYKNIRAFAFDVDGVFTDGGILCDLQGELYRTFDAKDSFAVRMAVMRGYGVAVITGGRSRSITQRFLTCGVSEEDIYLGSRVKTEELADFCARRGYSPEEILFIGDDIPDIGCMKLCGIGFCPADASAEVLRIADEMSEFSGGRGCVREAVTKVMKARGDWEFDPQLYKKMF